MKNIIIYHLIKLSRIHQLFKLKILFLKTQIKISLFKQDQFKENSKILNYFLFSSKNKPNQHKKINKQKTGKFISSFQSKSSKK